MGKGSLYERVEHEKTGFITKNKTQFIHLTDDKIYRELRKNLLKKRNSRNYKNVKEDLIKILFNNG